jgi:adenylate cyclase
VLAAIRKRLARFIIGLIVVAVFLAQAVPPWGLRLPLLANLEAIVYDTRLRLTMPQTVDSRIVILDIDEKSLAEREQGGEGHWPWPRDRLALLLDKLFDRYEVSIVGFDVVFAERDESSGIRVLERIAAGELREVPRFQAVFEKIRPELEYDAIFARKMKGRPVVLGYSFSSEEPASRKGLLPPPLFARGAFAGQPIGATTWSGYTANLEGLQQSAAAAGHINSWTDDDGVVRRVPMLAEHDGAYYEPLSLAMVRLLLGTAAVKPVRPDPAYSSADYQALEWLEVGPLRIPLDDTASALVPYRGRQGSYRYFSIVDVMSDLVPTEELKGKIVLVGTSAPGLLDLRATPVDPLYPGVEVHANMISGMLDGDIKQRPPYVVGAEFVLLLASGLAMALLLPLFPPLVSTLTTLAVLAAVLATNVLVFQHAGLVLPLASGLVMILVLFTLNMAYGFFVEARGMRPSSTTWSRALRTSRSCSRMCAASPPSPRRSSPERCAITSTNTSPS